MKNTHTQGTGILAVVIIIAILAAGAYYFISNRSETTQPASTPATSTYQSPDLGGWNLGLEAPTEVQFSQANESTIEAKYIGPNSIANSEITDGYFLSFHIENGASINEYTQSAGALGDVQHTELAGYDAYAYKTESALGGNIEHFAMQIGTAENAAVLDIGYVVAGNKSEEYNAEVSNILETLKVNKSL